MGLFSTDPVKKEEKALEKEAKLDVKQETQAEKDLERAKKQAAAAEKDHHKLVATHDKAIAKEHKLAEKANEAAHKHNEAVSTEQKLLNDIKAKEQHHAQLEQEIAAKKVALEQASHKHHLGDLNREEKRHSLEQSKNPLTAHQATGTTETTGTGTGLAANDPTFNASATGPASTTHTGATY